MTHDWFSHLEEGRNSSEMTSVGCAAQLINGVEKPLTPDEIAKLGCRPADKIDKSFIAEDSEPPTFSHKGKTYLTRSYKTTRNTVTAWWDASQLYGYSETSRRRVKRDPKDPAKLLLVPVSQRVGHGERLGARSRRQCLRSLGT